MKNKEERKQLWKNAGILFAITLTAGILLGFVHELTLEPIARQQERRIQRACGAVFADAASFEKEERTGEAPVILENVEIGEVYRALSVNGGLLGYVITVTTSEGYGEDIELLLGVRPDGTVNGVSVLRISETPGLGMRAEEVLAPQFAGRQVSSFTYVKTGAVSEDQIDAISGATITTSAFTEAVNAGLSYFDERLKEAE